MADEEIRTPKQKKKNLYDRQVKLLKTFREQNAISQAQYEKEPESFTKAFIGDVLEKYLWVVFITEDEDKRLNSAGLKQAMPHGWDYTKDSPFARYEACNIKVDWNK